MAPQAPRRSAVTIALFALTIPFAAASQMPPPSERRPHVPHAATNTAPGTGTTATGGTTAAPAAASRPLPRGERSFIEEAARANFGEIELARLAAREASFDAVKRYARRLEKEHPKANEALRGLASAKGVRIAEGPDREARGRLARMKLLEDPAFDVDFVKRMVRDHEIRVSAFEAQSKQAEDADVRRYAARSLRRLQEHLESARALEAEVEKLVKERVGATEGGDEPAKS